MSAFLVLLSTDHCTLCEEALSMLFSMPELAGVELRVVDVAQDNDLLERYGEQIPVLQVFAGREEPLVELVWPFSAASISTQLAALPPAADS